MDLNNTICATNGNHKKKQLILEARHSKVIEDANNKRSKLQPRIFMPKDVNKSHDNLPKNSQTSTAALKLRANNNVVKNLPEIPKLSAASITCLTNSYETNSDLKNIAQRVKRKLEKEKTEELKKINRKTIRNCIISRYKTKHKEINRNKRTIQNRNDAQQIGENNKGLVMSNSQGLSETETDDNQQNPEQDEDQDIEERLKEMGLEITDNNENSETSIDMGENTLRPAKTLNDSLEISENLEIDLAITAHDESSENLEVFDSLTHPPNSRNSTALAKDMPALTSNDSMESSRVVEMDLELTDNDEISENSETLQTTKQPPNFRNSIEFKSSKDSIKISKELEMASETLNNNEISETFETTTLSSNSQNSLNSAKKIAGNHEISQDLSEIHDHTTTIARKNQNYFKSFENYQHNTTLNITRNIIESSIHMKSLHHDYYEIIDFDINKNYKKFTRAPFKGFWNIIENTMTTLNEYVASSLPDVDTRIYDNVYNLEQSMNDFSNFILQNEQQIEEAVQTNESIISDFMQRLQIKKTLNPAQFPTNNENLLKQLLTQSTEDETMETTTLGEFEKNNGIAMAKNDIPRNNVPLTATRSQSAIPANTDRSLRAEQISHLKHWNHDVCERNNNQKSSMENSLEQIPFETIDLTNITNPLTVSQNNRQSWLNKNLQPQSSTSSLQIPRHSKLSSKSQRSKLKAHNQSRHNAAQKSSNNSIIQKSKFSQQMSSIPNENYHTQTQATQINMSCPRPFQPSNIYHMDNPIRIHTYSTNLKEVQPRYIELDIQASTQVNFNYPQQHGNPAVIEQMQSLDGYFRNPDLPFRPWIPFTATNFGNSMYPQATYPQMNFGSTIESVATFTNPVDALPPPQSNGMWPKTSHEWPSASSPYFNNTSLPLTPPADVNYQNLSFPINASLPTTFTAQHSYNLE